MVQAFDKPMEATTVGARLRSLWARPVKTPLLDLWEWVAKMHINPPGPVAPTLPQDSELYRLLVESITDYAVYVLDASGHVVSWNPGAQRFKGYAAHEIVGRHFSTFYTPEDRDAGVPDKVLRTAANKGRFEAEGWRVRNDGSRFWANVVIDPIRSPSGELVGYAKITRDLTERRAAADTLRESEEQLRLLIDGVTDYAIYMLTPEGQIRTLERRRPADQGLRPRRGYRPALLPVLCAGGPGGRATRRWPRDGGG